MKIAKDGIRSIVRIGYDGKVHKTFRGTDSDTRFANEINVLKVLEQRGCDFVPRLLDFDEETLTIVTSNCGQPVDKLSEKKTKALFKELEDDFGIIHDDPFDRNVTYHSQMGRFCVIDFELAQILANPEGDEEGDLLLRWGGLSKAGSRYYGRKNDDSLAAFCCNEGWGAEQDLTGKLNLAEEGIVLAVSDGMGGANGGSIASRICVSELRRFLPGKMGVFATAADPLTIMEAAVQGVHVLVNRIGEKNTHLEGMGATLVCALLTNRVLHFAHVGDSRIYLHRNGDLVQLTFDQSYVGKMHHSGKLNEREARNHPHRNILSQVIGADSEKIIPQLGSYSLESGDHLLLCSDGLIDGLWDKNIRAVFDKATEKDWAPEQTAQELMDSGQAVSSKDDTTLFVARVGSVPQKPEA